MRNIIFIFCFFSVISLDAQVLTFTDLKDIYKNVGTEKTPKILLERDFILLRNYKDENNQTNNIKSINETWAYGYDANLNSVKIAIHIIFSDSPQNPVTDFVIVFHDKSNTLEYLQNKIKEYCGEPELVGENYNRIYKHQDNIYFAIYYSHWYNTNIIEIMDENAYLSFKKASNSNY